MEIHNLTSLLMSLWKNADNYENKLSDLKQILCTTPPRVVQETQQFIMASVNMVLKNCADNKSQSKRLRRIVTDIFKILFEKSRINSVNDFFFVYRFLLNEISDHNHPDRVASINEEYKLSIVNSIISLVRALSWDVVSSLYVQDNTLILCSIFHLIIEVAKTEQLRSLRLASIECIMCLAKVDDSSDWSDIEMRSQIADVIKFYLPGIVSSLAEIIIKSDKCGHSITLLAIRAWGRIVALGTQNYDATDAIINTREVFNQDVNVDATNDLPKIKWKSKEEIEKYLQSSKRDLSWYKEVDGKLQAFMVKFKAITRHSHKNVRFELIQTCRLLIDCCAVTLPITTGKAIEILIILLEDEDREISNNSATILSLFSENFSSNIFKNILENLEENFYGTVTSLPRIFSGLDEAQQLSAINLLIGYLKLFGKTRLAQVLHSTSHLKRLIQTLIQITELESKSVTLHEEYMIQDLDLVADYRTPWKSFRYFLDSSIQDKLQKACALLAECKVLDITTDLLLDIFISNKENRKEATLVLNDVLLGVSGSPNVSDHLYIIKNVINTYLEPDYWNLPLDVTHNCTLPEIQNNIIQICLQVEGLSKIALAIKGDFKQFLLKVLYPVLDRAGSGHPLIKAAGTTAIINISVACGYPNVTELINENCDYFSYNVTRKIKRAEHNESVLNVLTTVMRYSNINILDSISDIINGVLLQTCDQFFQKQNANVYLRVFQVFVRCLVKWFDITVIVEPIKSKHQKELEHEPFKISNMCEEENYSNEDAEKTAYDMYKEDAEMQVEDEFQDCKIEEYEKPKPPNHVQLTVCLLQRAIHFLPSKDRNCKLAIIDILKHGFEIIRDWDDELLPLVHQVWSPLVGRFKEKDDYLIINYSFQLLVILARLSKDFIRSRTTSDVLPIIQTILNDLSRKSYLQDKGSAYRYTQAYKLQLSILQHLAKVVTDLDLTDHHIIPVMEAVSPYLSDKQPIPLQEACLGFYGDLAKFDTNLVDKTLHKINNTELEQGKLEYKKNVDAVLKTIHDFK